MSLETIKSAAVLSLRGKPIDAPKEADDGSHSQSKRSPFLSKRGSFLLLVALPALIAAFYYYFMASPQYVVEARMIVRTIGVSEKFDTSEEREGRSIIGGDSLTQDSYIVANYLESAELVSILNEEIGLQGLFSRADIDWFSRLPKEAHSGRLNRFWRQQIDTYVDGPSGIIAFTVRAFSPEEALLIMNHAIAASDRMVDRLSERAKLELVERAEQDVRISLNRYTETLEELRNYQNETGILDPISQARITNEIVSKLVEEKLSLLIQQETLKASNIENDSRLTQLERSIEALDREIQARRNSIAGTPVDGVQLSESLTEFSRLETKRLVTKAIYEAGVRNLDTAKATALRKTTFISVFSQPVLPTESRYPERLSSWAIFSLGLLTLWATGTLIWMSIQDHRV